MYFTKDLVKAILERPYLHDWSLQGFGMLRMYLSPEVRLHIWDERFMVENVSQIHTHPWDFDSLVVAGEVTNFRYLREIEAEIESNFYSRYMEQVIRCGEGGGLVGGPTVTKLRILPGEVYRENQWYRQTANEIHVSNPEDGTVTIIKRSFKQDTEHASVFWPVGNQWVSAEPRPANEGEIRDITSNALNRWF